MGEKIKYWLLTTEFPPFYGGGISTYCRETVSLLSGLDHAVSVFLPDPAVSDIVIDQHGDIRIIRFNPHSHTESEFLGNETLISLAFARALKRIMEAEGPPDLIESQEYNGIAYFTLLYKWLRYPLFKDLVVLITVHAPSFVCLPYNHVVTYKFPYFWIGEMEKFCLKAADVVISPSHYVAEKIKQIAPEVQLRYERVFNPFGMRESDVPAEPAVAVSSQEFIFYGKASPLKGIFELLIFFKWVWEKYPAVQLRIIGGTDYYYHPEGRLMEDILKEKYGRYIAGGQLILEGQIAPQDLAVRIARARAILIPSRIDNLPYAVIECMALGKVVLGSTSGGHTELIEDGKNGFLFSLEDEASFREKMDRLIAADAALLNKMGQEAMRTIREKCDPARVGEQKEAVLKAVLGRKAGSTSFPFLRPVGHPGAAVADMEPEKKEKGLLSVVIPYYNMGAYVEETVASILQSAYPAIEILIVNDGSTEEASIEKLNSFSGNPSIRIIHKENGGLSLARNTGALQARGEFLAFLDPDDKVDARYYATAIDILGYYDNVYFAGSWVSYFGTGRGFWPCFTPEPPFVLYHNMINTSALVYKKEYFLRYGLNDKALLFGMEDYDSLLGMLENGCSGVAIPEPFFHYRVRKDSMARQFTPAKILYLYQLLAVKHSEFYRKFAAEVVNLLNSNGQGFLHDNPSLDLHIDMKSRVVKKIIGRRGIEFIRKSKHLKKRLIQIQRLLKI